MTSAGRRLAGLVTRLDDALAHGTSRIVLDATWPTRAQRSAVIETAWRHGAPVRCVFFDPPQPRLAVNAVNRLLDRYGRLLDPDELAAQAKSDPHAFGPDALLRVKSRFEPPEDDEGFAAIDRPEAFVLAPAGTRRAVFVAGRWLRESLDLPLLVRLASDDAVVVAIEWWPEGDPDPIAEVGGVPIVTYACRHPGGPPRCWCRPPWPGLLVAACREHEIDPARSIFLGRSASDAALAAALAIPHAS